MPMIALEAAHWLEHTLWPVARAAAAVPEGVGLDELLDRAHAAPDPRSGSYPLACALAEELPLLGATLMACELARSPRAAAIRELIDALIWRDAFELACARDLVVAMGMAGVRDDEFTDRHIAAIEVWDRWKGTAEEVEAAVLSFVASSGGLVFGPDGRER